MNGNIRRIMVIVALCLIGPEEATCSEPLQLTVANNDFAGTYYDASEKNKPVGVIVLGGSEGGTPVQHAKAFADKGYSALALGYFKVPGRPDFLDEIALDYFDVPIKWFAEQPGMRGRKIVLYGGSKGAELALLLASRKDQISGVIAVSPSSVVFQGIPKMFWPPRSSWKAGGKPIPFVPYDVSRGVNVKNLRPLYEQSLTHTQAVKNATIPVEKINGPILLLSGTEDTMWPAADMADAIMTRLESKAFPHPCRHLKFEKAGHTLNEFYMMGGTKDGNQRARKESWQGIYTFLADHFGKKKGK